MTDRQRNAMNELNARVIELLGENERLKDLVDYLHASRRRNAEKNEECNKLYEVISRLRRLDPQHLSGPVRAALDTAPTAITPDLPLADPSYHRKKS